MAIHIKSANHLSELLKEHKSKLIILDFYTDWCGPCKALAPKLEELTTTDTNVKVFKADADDDNLESLTAFYKISSLPTLIFFRDEKVVDHFSGANIQRIKEVVEKFSECE